MRLRDVLSMGIAREVIKATGETFNDEYFTDRLTQAGGLVALIGIGIDLYKKVQNSRTSQGEKSFASLAKIVFLSSEQVLEELRLDISIDKNEKKKTLEDLLEVFNETSDWNSYLPDHPAINKFRSIIITILAAHKTDSDKIREFVIKFNLRLEVNAGEDNDFKLFYDWWTTHKEYRDLIEHLEKMKSKNTYTKSVDRKPLSQYYVQQQAVLADASSWNVGDEGVRKKYKDAAKDLEQLIAERLMQQKPSQPIVIAASFGMGKTSLVRTITSSYASRYLQENDVSPTTNASHYIPILVSLVDGLSVEEEPLKDILSKIAPCDNDTKDQGCKRNIVLILDGLDEYEGKRDQLMKEMYSLHQKYSNMKFIITTRLIAGLPAEPHTGSDELRINVDPHIRLLPFTKEEVDTFFNKYGISDKITYDIAIDRLAFHALDKRGLYSLRTKQDAQESDEPLLITKPLFAWMLALMYSDSELKIDFKADWNDNMKKSLIYMLFFHYIIKGKLRSTYETSEWKELYIDEKKTLREIAKLKQIYGSDLSESILREKFQSTPLSSSYEENIQRSNTTAITTELDPILTSYFRLKSDIKAKGKIVDFMHESFKDYLLAEYYIQSLLVEEKPYKLNIGIPSQVTISFIDGLIELLNNAQDLSIRRFVQGDESDDAIGLLNSFEYYEPAESVEERLISICSRCINEEHIVFLNPSERVKENQRIKEETFWTEADIDVDSYKRLWIHRWISYYILNKLDPQKAHNDKLLELVCLTGRHVPSYLKNFSQLDFSSNSCAGIDLSNAHISYADFSGADLSCANFSRATISRFVTGGGDDPFADFSGAQFSNAKLGNAKGQRIDAQLDGVILSGANFIDADLSCVGLSYSDLSGANMNGAMLIGANLSGANLSGATLIGADLTQSDLSGTDISAADLSSCKLTSCEKYLDLKCAGTDFSHSIIDNIKLITHLRDSGAQNVPDIISQEELNKRTRKYWRFNRFNRSS